ncbi:YkvI family membrane protein [Mobilicoccus caccae]|uniref:Membrane protein n=1 Tax=Mobilicoccus caccae TaxID=1859295 RepID=A0ABQ6IXV5_9MICO|nr:hypothetical protein [Mobilicoccus caccae]GMA42246.1 membrane protein [Mobilicoccus caccae]
MAKRTTTFGIAATYIGTVIGAGFASGQEVLQYFVSFGPAGLAAIVLATLLFFGFGALAMLLGHHLQTDRYAPIMEWRGYRLPRLFADFFITLSLAGTFVIMVAGAGSTFAQAFGVPAFVGSIAVGVLCILNLLKGLDGLVRVQSILVPLLIAGAIGVAVHAILNPIDGGGGDAAAQVNSSPLINQWTMAGILYVAFNVQLAIAVLVPLGHGRASVRSMVWGALIGALGLGAGAAAVYLAMNANASLVGTAELPMVDLADRIGPGWGLAYSVVLFIGLYSTAVSCFYGSVHRVTSSERLGNPPTMPVMIGVAVAGVVLSFVGFTDLISYVYPILGYGGMVIMLILLAAGWDALRTRRRGQDSVPTGV